jgi:hypothetical protein
MGREVLRGFTAEDLDRLARALAPSASSILVRDDNPRGPGTTDIEVEGATGTELARLRGMLEPEVQIKVV